jgi:alpha-galactosidase
VGRRWSAFRSTAWENLRRGWQNGRLWWNDPDCVLLGRSLTDGEFLFHITSIYAGGGMLLSGDDMPRMTGARLALLRKMSPPTGRAAAFDAGLRMGRLKLPGRELVFLLNWTDTEEEYAVEGVKGRVRDYWSGEEVA